MQGKLGNLMQDGPSSAYPEEQIALGNLFKKYRDRRSLSQAGVRALPSTYEYSPASEGHQSKIENGKTAITEEAARWYCLRLNIPQAEFEPLWRAYQFALGARRPRSRQTPYKDSQQANETDRERQMGVRHLNTIVRNVYKDGKLVALTFLRQIEFLRDDVEVYLSLVLCAQDQLAALKYAPIVEGIIGCEGKDVVGPDGKVVSSISFPTGVSRAFRTHTFSYRINIMTGIAVPGAPDVVFRRHTESIHEFEFVGQQPELMFLVESPLAEIPTSENQPTRRLMVSRLVVLRRPSNAHKSAWTIYFPGTPNPTLAID